MLGRINDHRVSRLDEMLHWIWNAQACQTGAETMSDLSSASVRRAETRERPAYSRGGSGSHRELEGNGVLSNLQRLGRSSWNRNALLVAT